MKKKKARILFLIPILLALFACATIEPVKESTEDSEITQLIRSMTIEEKVGQMTQLNLDVVCVGEVYKLSEPHRLDQDKVRKALVDYHVGSILNCGGHAYPREQWLELIGGIQKVAMEETRLKIPVLYGIDAIHGANYVMGSTLFPQQLAQAASFNTELTRQAAEVTAYETRAAGMPWNFSPVLDCGRNPLWSRFFETYGEDPLMCSRFGEAAVIGYQGKKNEEIIDQYHVAACMKHFLGYSGMRTGKDRTPAYITEIQLREIYLPSFRKAVESGALTVMINSGEINGIPVHADKRILTDLLRNELKFEGLAVTDWEDIIKLHANHKVASSLKEAVRMAVDAGIDMCMVPNDYNFTILLIELVKEGKITESRLDESVKRILQIKKKLGILRSWKNPSLADYPKFASAEFAALAKKSALESITLLENKNKILPLSKEKKILVTGPAAQSMTMLNGAWSRTWQGVDASFDNPAMNTIAEALVAQNPARVSYAAGCGIDQMNDASAALSLAAESDIIIACMGEAPSTEKPGDIDELDLPQAQVDFVKKLQETGKPVILVLVENRPRIVREIVDQCSAVIMAYQPGDYGGDALAEIIYGKVSPSGRLPFTYPRHNHSLMWYDHKYTETLDQNFGNNAFHPQWEFGDGLSYAEISYGKMSSSTDTLNDGGTMTVSIELSNRSKFDVNHSILLFYRDHYASVTPSVKKLIDFDKITLKANSTATVTFTVNTNQMSFLGRDLQPTTEAGDFDLILGDQVKQVYLRKP